MNIEQMIPWLSVVIAYLLGSIPTSYIIGKLFFQKDIRQSGSGNTGATNTLRTFGTKAGVIVLLIDILKGAAAIWVGKAMSQGITSAGQIHLLVSLCGLAVILGHIYSIFLGFKGGKGVATAGGVFLAMSPITLMMCLVLFLYVVYSTKYVSVGSMLAALAFLLIELIYQYIMNFPNLPRLVLTLLVVAMIFYRHKENIRRLKAGNENKFGQRSPRQV